MSEKSECLLRAGTKKRLTDLKSDHGKPELLGVWLPGRVQNPKATSVSFAGGSMWQEAAQLPDIVF